MESIIQDWAACLGLRHQGVLVSAVRGCDSVDREDASKILVRTYRGVLLKSHCGDISKAASFMIPFDPKMWDAYKMDFLVSIDHYPNHWLLHFMHACEIVGYKHSDGPIRVAFIQLYYKLVKKFHLQSETESVLDQRLNADEKTFAQNQVEKRPFAQPTKTNSKETSKRDGIALMNAEFDALEKLQKATRRMHDTPVVDDDYPEMRHYYNSALQDFIDALKNNRGERLWK
jgi:hypothetical protein